MKPEDMPMDPMKPEDMPMNPMKPMKPEDMPMEMKPEDMPEDKLLDPVKPEDMPMEMETEDISKEIRHMNEPTDQNKLESLPTEMKPGEVQLNLIPEEMSFFIKATENPMKIQPVEVSVEIKPQPVEITKDTMSPDGIPMKTHQEELDPNTMMPEHTLVEMEPAEIKPQDSEVGIKIGNKQGKVKILACLVSI
jgi:hypothetical protein